MDFLCNVFISFALRIKFCMIRYPILIFFNNIFFVVLLVRFGNYEAKKPCLIILFCIYVLVNHFNFLKSWCNHCTLLYNFDPGPFFISFSFLQCGYLTPYFLLQVIFQCQTQSVICESGLETSTQNNIFKYDPRFQKRV